MGIEQVSGLILNKTKYSNTSLITTVLTSEEGLMRFIGKGFRKLSKRANSPREPVETFCEMDIIFYRSASGDLHYLKECSTLNPFMELRPDYSLFVCASFGAGLALDFSAGGGEGEYKALKELWAGLCAGLDCCIEVIRYWAKVLELGGFLPSLECCSSCGKPFEDKAVRSSNSAGLVCGRCCGDEPGKARMLTMGDLKYLSHVIVGEGSNAGRLKMPANVRGRIMAFLNSLSIDALGRPPRLLDRIHKTCDNMGVKT